jgi:hypothetical protein
VGLSIPSGKTGTFTARVLENEMSAANRKMHTEMTEIMNLSSVACVESAIRGGPRVLAVLGMYVVSVWPLESDEPQSEEVVGVPVMLFVSDTAHKANMLRQWLNACIKVLPCEGL